MTSPEVAGLTEAQLRRPPDLDPARRSMWARLLRRLALVTGLLSGILVVPVLFFGYLVLFADRAIQGVLFVAAPWLVVLAALGVGAVTLIRLLLSVARWLDRPTEPYRPSWVR